MKKPRAIIRIVIGLVILIIGLYIFEPTRMFFFHVVFYNQPRISSKACERAGGKWLEGFFEGCQLPGEEINYDDF
ncbi:MAG: hypothetical protein A3B31_01155 [Candidatus Komeilibacteria bacterium RIFCSPLOWO2_01_FULL_53_11]|uniref:Uncharacterized protein n=1 Tax=Candidatus Komeilibacteria bacterium RIFCSPLOWO2_01_FULL_53_11 TaxID=1798552 RepID=A0A1G2BTK7_9BACT|nr:MAG: hypothetical protein A3B31_01155 [Candidatus Komeilibacteria bacterium RIFCSPLOWO2_01_FULL_53_11]